MVAEQTARINRLQKNLDEAKRCHRCSLCMIHGGTKTHGDFNIKEHDD